MFTYKSDRENFEDHFDALKEKLTFPEFETVRILYKKSMELKERSNCGEREEDTRTKEILTELRKLGRDLGYSTKNYHRGRAEWLFDLVWLVDRKCSWSTQFAITNTEKETWENFEKIKLACEMEWNGNGQSVLEDFAKLTVVKADFRLFIHSNQYYDPTKLNTVDMCKAIVPCSTGDRYLFVGFDQYRRSPEFRVDFMQA